MAEILLLIGMLFCHIVDDYYLQGFLASAKQKSWWEKNNPNPLYKNDYITKLDGTIFKCKGKWQLFIYTMIILI